MSRTKAKLERALQTGDVPAVIAFFSGATEAERKSFAPVVAGWHEILALNRDAHYFAERREQIPAGQRFDNYHQLYPAAFAATLACGSFMDAKAVRDTLAKVDELRTGKERDAATRLEALTAVAAQVEADAKTKSGRDAMRLNALAETLKGRAAAMR